MRCPDKSTGFESGWLKLNRATFAGAKPRPPIIQIRNWQAA